MYHRSFACAVLEWVSGRAVNSGLKVRTTRCCSITCLPMEVPLDELGNALARLRRLPQVVVPHLGCTIPLLCLVRYTLFCFINCMRKDLLDLAQMFMNQNSWGRMRALVRWADKQPWRKILPQPFKSPSYNLTTLVPWACLYVLMIFAYLSCDPVFV